MFLAAVLRGMNRLEEAVAVSAETARAFPDQVWAHNALGGIRWEVGDAVGAIEAYEDAIRINPQATWVTYNLGMLYLYRGEFRSAIARLVQGSQLLMLAGYATQVLGGSATLAMDQNVSASEEWIAECRLMLELEPDLEKIAEGSRAPETAEEAADFARLCFYSGRALAAVRLYEQAFGMDATMDDDLDGEYRYQAARAAILAGTGLSRDSGELGEEARREYREKGLAWLREDLKAWQSELDSSLGPTDFQRRNRRSHWRYGHPAAWNQDPHLRGVVHPEALEKLPEEERAAWTDFWEGAAALGRMALNTR
jgi:tetratricopeptide (TPR) repeat protein